MMSSSIICLLSLIIGNTYADEKAYSEAALNPFQTPLTPQQQHQGELDFEAIYTVLQHPRCLNCHPSGDAPLQGEQSLPHVMNITRSSSQAGLECAACHQTQNSESYGVDGGPPGAPNWHLPSKDMPLVFQGLSINELCEQLKDPARNGQMSLTDLYNHIATDPLVIWGWTPGGARSVPPIPHDVFAAHFKSWVSLGGPCPSP